MIINCYTVLTSNRVDIMNWKDKSKEIRKGLGLSQRAFAKHIGFADNIGGQILVSNIETGASPVSVKTEIILRYIEKYGIL